MFSPQRLIEIVSKQSYPSESRLRVMWAAIPEDGRDTYAEELREAAGPLAIVPIVLRSPLFMDPNLLLSDVNRLLESHRSDFERLESRACSSGVTVVLLAKGELRLPQTSSPIQLPSWFPVDAGREVFFRISDVAADANVVLLNAEEARVDDMAAALFELEQTMVKRAAKASVQALSAFLKESSTSKESVPDAVVAAAMFDEHLRNVRNGRAYRPSVRTGSSLASRLIRLVLKNSPDELLTASSHVSKVLGLVDEQIRPPMLAILLRPTRPLDNASGAAHTLMLTVYGAYQFITGAAHAGDYPACPVGLVYHTSMDLRRSLRSANHELSIVMDD